MAISSLSSVPKLAAGDRFSKSISCFVRIRESACKKAKCVNDLFELAHAHAGIQKCSRKLAESAVCYLHRANLFLDPFHATEGMDDRISSIPFQREEKPEYSPFEAAFIQLAAPLTTMSLYGLGSAVLGLYAKDLPLSVLAVLTWGSFRWNENELLHRFGFSAEADPEMRKVFNKSRLQFLQCFCVLFSYYLLLYFYARGNVSNAMTQKVLEKFAPYQPAAINFLVQKKYSLLMRNKEEIMKGLTEESGALFAQSLTALEEAINRGDLEEMQVLLDTIADLTKDLPLYLRSSQLFE